MGYATKVQRINRKKYDQWYVGLPAAVAKAMEFLPSELVEWTIEDKATLVLRRVNPPASSLKKKRRGGSSTASKSSGSKRARPSAKSARGRAAENLR